ncbi:MAG: ferrous iron transport protein B, partial [Candidatus Omnitrophica bacterium]|nr:ferrous iron transport protein B [Candidatus Omnitrophota bacterium]
MTGVIQYQFSEGRIGGLYDLNHSQGSAGQVSLKVRHGVEIMRSSKRRADSALVVTGNPNVGKSVLFHLLTGRYVNVSNYPGTTVMVSEGKAALDGREYRVKDTPGLNSLTASSEDELVARDLILKEDGVILQIADAKNLPRALTLTLEIAEAGRPLVLNLNMMDEARERRIQIDSSRLSELLDIPVVPTVATQRVGLDKLRHALPAARRARAQVTYPPVIEEALAEIEGLIPQGLAAPRAWALLWLSRDAACEGFFKGELEPEALKALTRVRAIAEDRTSYPLSYLIAQARRIEAARMAQAVMRREGSGSRTVLKRAGDLAMHPVWGLFFLGGVLALMYIAVGDWAAQKGVGFLEEVVFGRFFVPWAEAAVRATIPWELAQSFLIGEYGILTMAAPYAFAIILPIVGMFFLFFGMVEDVGYLPRLAVMANRFLRCVGLNGKAVLPLVLGLGCDTMATMTTRILDTRRDRILATLLLALGIPCSAQLGVVMAMLAPLSWLGTAIWLAVLAGVLVVVGKAAAKLIGGEESPFLYEIPPLRWPKWSNVLIKTLGRLEWYVREAVPLFFLGTAALFALDRSGILRILERTGSPLVVSWLGLPAKATGAFIMGFLRRDFGAAGFYDLQRNGFLTGTQTVVSLVTLTLFVPCIAQYFMMIKERGLKTASLMALL